MSFFVTGTDTEIGKTLVSSAILHNLVESGQPCDVQDRGSGRTIEVLVGHPARLIGEDYNLYYSVWCTNEHELYEMNVSRSAHSFLVTTVLTNRNRETHTSSTTSTTTKIHKCMIGSLNASSTDWIPCS